MPAANPVPRPVRIVEVPSIPLDPQPDPQPDGRPRRPRYRYPADRPSGFPAAVGRAA